MLWVAYMINFIIGYNVFRTGFTFWGGWSYLKKILYLQDTTPGDKYRPVPIFIVFCFFFIVAIILFITSYIYSYIMFLLIYIFIAWLIIKYIVPVVYIFFIPFPPFFAPIPLRYVILEYVPPFKELTDAGILPLMERLLYTFISGEVIKNKIITSFGYIFDFIRIYIKDIIKKAFPNIDLDSYFSNVKEEDKEIKITEEQIIEQNKNEYYQKAIKIINAEYENCYNANKQKLDNLSEAEIALATINNEGIKLKCYSDSISSYVKANY